jgi:hypothetical protein
LNTEFDDRSCHPGRCHDRLASQFGRPASGEEYLGGGSTFGADEFSGPLAHEGMVARFEELGGLRVGDDEIVVDREHSLVGPAVGGQELLEQRPLPFAGSSRPVLLGLNAGIGAPYQRTSICSAGGESSARF